MSSLPRLYTPEEVAAALRVSPWWVRDQARKGRISASKVGGAWRFTADQYHQLVAASATPVIAPTPARSSRSTAQPYYADSTAPVVSLTPRTPRRRRVA